jgi:prepilin-type N-terminal cleavage/methylation domain-containing protein
MSRSCAACTKKPPPQRPFGLRFRRLRGFTLVELLAVISIIATLFAAMLSVSRGGDTAKVRRAAQEFAGLLLAAQTQALGRPEGAAVIVTGEAASNLGTVISEGRCPPAIAVGVEDDGTLAGHPELAAAYKVRFRRPAGEGSITVSPWLGLGIRATPPGEEPRWEPRLRSTTGQTPENTLLELPGDDLEAIVARYPTPATKAVRLPDEIAIDLRHSGAGDDPAAGHGHGSLDGCSPLAIVFDQTGRVGEIIQNLGASGGPPNAPVRPSQILYFLFAERYDIERGRSLASEKSVWVAVNPHTGRIGVSANVPADNLAAARARARTAMVLGL